MNLEGRLSVIRADSERIALCALGGELTAPVTACPDWDLRALVTHVGGIHRWATIAIDNAEMPVADKIEMPEPDASGSDLGAWMREGAAALTDLLAVTGC
jgi:hypothetical protein